jgi:hypothetical protein
MELELELSEAQIELLRIRAKSLGIAPEDLARAAVVDLLAKQDDEFESALGDVLSTNRELYRRLA